MSRIKVRAQFPKAFRELDQPARYKVYYGGRGGAKSWAVARKLLIRATQQKLLILCTRELQSSIEESVHRLLSDQIEKLQLSSEFEVVQKSIRCLSSGSEFIFEGLRYNTDKIKSMEGVDICWVEEADKVKEASWAILIPTIRAPNSEFWVTFNPSLKTDATWQRFVEHSPPDAIVRKVSWRDNPWFPAELRAEMEHLKSVDYDAYLHIWEGEFKSYAEGAVYGKQLREAREAGRIRTNLPLQASCEVHTCWDLGKADATAIWFFQHVGPEIRFIDYEEGRLQDIDHYVKVIKEKGYNYGKHYMPHDVEHELLGMGNRTRKQMFEQGGVKPIVVVPRIRHLNEGIEMVRQAFPSYWFDAEKCERGLECLQNYAYEYSDKSIDYKPEPAHNWASHAADALRQQAQGFRGASLWDERIPTTHRGRTLNPWATSNSAWMT